MDVRAESARRAAEHTLPSAAGGPVAFARSCAVPHQGPDVAESHAEAGARARHAVHKVVLAALAEVGVQRDRRLPAAPGPGDCVVDVRCVVLEEPIATQNDDVTQDTPDTNATSWLMLGARCHDEPSQMPVWPVRPTAETEATGDATEIRDLAPAADGRIARHGLPGQRAACTRGTAGRRQCRHNGCDERRRDGTLLHPCLAPRTGRRLPHSPKRLQRVWPETGHRSPALPPRACLRPHWWWAGAAARRGRQITARQLTVTVFDV